MTSAIANRKEKPGKVWERSVSSAVCLGRLRVICVRRRSRMCALSSPASRSRTYRVRQMVYHCLSGNGNQLRSRFVRDVQVFLQVSCCSANFGLDPSFGRDYRV